MSNQSDYVQALPNQTILKGRYLIERCIGSGGFGITYRAQNLQRKGDAVAIKEYFPRAVVERGEKGAVRVREGAEKEYARWQENYEREYRLLARLRGNRAIINVRETFRENATSYLVMDYIPGETLEACVRAGGPLSGEAVMALMRPVLPELAKMHHAGILHRDINPSNIILPPGDLPKLIDFGSARPVPGAGGRLTSFLRPGYAPPEQYDARARQGPQTDVYGLCASLYFALTGKRPPDGLQRASRDDMPPLEALCAGPKRLVQAVTHGLEPDPARRAASFEALWYEMFGEEAAPPVAQPARKPAVEHVRPIASVPRPGVEHARASTPARHGGGAHCAARLAAARQVAGLLGRVNAQRYRPLLEELDVIERRGLTDDTRVALEEAILARGKAFSLLCALATRKST